MSKKTIILGIIIMLVATLITTSFAATGTVEFKADKTGVKAGEEFTITLKANSDDGINGISTKYTYDTSVLEKISENVVDSANWSSISGTSEIAVICNSSETLKTADIYTIKFKVKDGVAVGTKAKIETEEILLDTDTASNSEVKIPAKTVEITVNDGTATGTTTNTTNETTTNITNNLATAKTNSTKTETTQTTASNSNQTYTGGTLPKTGVNEGIVTLGIIVTLIGTIIGLKKYLEYRDIK